jgi:NAD(P)-dependent dehydrogenase (short-subunit alcohol dehydrogenase family)
MDMSHWTTVDIPSQKDKVAIVTGANSGIGFQTSLELARAGAKVVLACRNKKKGVDAVDRIIAAVPNAQTKLLIVDLSDLASFPKFVADFSKDFASLDLLVNNAAIMALPERTLSAQGFEAQFGTNHLGHFALTDHLMKFLLAATAPRVVTVSSNAHKNGRIDFENLQLETGYTGWRAYNQSKVANLLFAFELQRKVKAAGSNLLSVASHPGVSHTNIIQNGPNSGKADLKSRIIEILGPLFMQSDAQGALPILYAATVKDIPPASYYGPDGPFEIRGYPKQVHPTSLALDTKVAAELWTRSEALTGARYEALASQSATRS